MLAEIVTIGDELCRGEIVDTNSSWLAAKLWDLDITVAWMTSCRDLNEDIERTLRDATGRADLVLVSGGLGPTEDDLTVDVVATLVGVGAVEDAAARTHMEERYRAASFALTPNNLRQVRVPEGARVLGNPAGQAPAFEVELGGVPVVCMPGIPRELHAIFERSLRARVVELREARGEKVERIARRIFRVFGKGESHIAQALEGVVEDVKGASLHYQVKFPETLVKVVVRDRDLEVARSRLEAVDARIRAALGARLYGVDDDSLPAALGRALQAAQASLATAESCTAGMIGSLITSVPGASGYYVGGAVTYANQEKVRQLGVSPATLEREGAVSEACAIEMAHGTRARFGTEYAVAVTGIAGPEGGTPDKPVGTVWLAVVGPTGEPRTRRFVWPGARDQIRTLASYWALAMVLRQVTEQEGSDGE
ncbi:MAG TPA: competence/damage-inducible protein A [Kofleriaceae bacterium]|nr:competence/damage-inducible protein A [Kofleriaceae bacterium]